MPWSGQYPLGFLLLERYCWYKRHLSDLTRRAVAIASCLRLRNDAASAGRSAAHHPPSGNI